MKILMVSIPSLHFFRWTEQLKDSEHQVYWFDVSGMSSYSNKIGWVEQKVGWKLKWNYPGRIFIKKRFPKLYKYFQRFNEYKTEKIFEAYLEEIKPDVVHSFALYISCSPIVSVMERNPDLKWIYSSWGSDLFYFQNSAKYLKDIMRVLPRVNYLFTDCNRDYELAKKYGFDGEFLGVFPGGGGFDLESIKKFHVPVSQRKVILIKGFQGRSGRAITVMKAIQSMKKELDKYEIIVFGADKEVFEYAEFSKMISWSNFKILGKILHEEVLRLMGKSLIYIGNSNSDGMPNTMLEAVCSGAFPIQSNPGGASAELIINGENGFLIENCENVEEIKSQLLKTINTINFTEVNKLKFKINLDYFLIKKIVVEKYNNLWKK